MGNPGLWGQVSGGEAEAHKKPPCLPPPPPQGPLKVAIEKLAGRLQFPLKKLYKMDGSKRSGHSNA